jgi:hypothetical protein
VKFPKALEQVSKTGDLPLYIALQCTVSLEVVTMIVEKYPKALEQVNKTGDPPPTTPHCTSMCSLS